MSYQRVLDSVARDVSPLLAKGRVAGYIPALARVSRTRFGMAVAGVDGSVERVGDAETPFSIQSISKLFTLTLVMRELGAKLWRRIGREPSGTAFNSLIQLERENGIPRNPFINAGAHVVTDCLVSLFPEPATVLLEFLREQAANPAVELDPEVARSEAETGHRNRALASFLKSFGNLVNPVDEVLDTYFHQCSITMSVTDLARAALFLAREGRGPEGGRRVLSARHVKRINALMMTCGTYDACGDFAYRVGLPAKSGVGGGIVAVLPGQFSVAVWSPALNEQGNSLAGTKALELFTTRTRLSVF